MAQDSPVLDLHVGTWCLQTSINMIDELEKSSDWVVMDQKTNLYGLVNDNQDTKSTSDQHFLIKLTTK